MRRLQSLYVCLLFCGLTGSANLQAAVFHTTLDNGLTVLLEERHTQPVVTVQVFVRTGSIYEQEYLGSGISHFFEHIIHGGTTTTRSETESQALLEAIGNNSNAYTTTDHTAYYINTTTEHWHTALDLLADWMLHSTIAEAEFLREKGVVQRELEQDLDDPQRALFETATETRYQVHPVRYPVIGYKELVQKVSRDDLVTYYRRMYAPNNMILVVVGDVDTEPALARIRQAFASGERRLLPAISLPEEPPQLGKRTIVKDMDIAQAHLNVSFRTVPLTHPDLYALDVLSDILSNGESTRLVTRLKDAQQLVYSISSTSYTPAYAPGTLSVWATLEPEKLQDAETAILQELARLTEALVSPEEVAKAKKQKIAEHIFGQENVQARARTLGLDMLSTYNPHFSEHYVQNIQRVTAEDVRQVARRYFQEDTLVVAAVRPKPDQKTAATTAQAAPAEPVVKRVLANGMTLLLKRHPAVPAVAMQASFQGGVRVETPATNGLSHLMTQLLLKGTTSRSAETIASTFDTMGGKIEAGSGNNSFYITTECLREDFSTALTVLADVLQHPSFPEAEIAKIRRLALASLEQQNDDWRSEVDNLFRNTFFTVSPYRLQPEGSSDTLKRFQRADLMAFYQQYVVPNNMALAIVGDIDPEAAATAVTQAFASFQARPLPSAVIPAEPTPTHTRRQVKHTQKQVAAIQIGFPGTTLSNLQDRYALHILDAIVSGIGFPGGWLHTELRGKQLVYVVHAFNWFGIDPGYFGIMAATQPHKVDEVVDIILKNMEKAKAGDMSDDELARAKRLTLIAERLDRQTSAQLAREFSLNELYGLGYDFSEREMQQFEKVTKADVQRVARTYLHDPTIVITTPNREQM